MQGAGSKMRKPHGGGSMVLEDCMRPPLPAHRLKSKHW